MTAKDHRPAKYIETGLAVPNAISEAVCNYIIENLSNGLVIDDEKYSDKTEIRFYMPESPGNVYIKKIIRYINDIEPALHFSEMDLSSRYIDDIEWIQAYKNSVQPVYIDNIVVRPPWLQAGKKDLIEIIIEPKMAFGTGHHESTRLCIRAIEKYLKKGDSFFDLGCGSGILSIIAAKVGAKRGMGVDIESTAVDNARENMLINKVADIIEIEQGSVEWAMDTGPYDILVANIIIETILELFREIYKVIRPGGIIILSGLLLEDEKAVMEMLKIYKFKEYEITCDGRWLAFAITK